MSTYYSCIGVWESEKRRLEDELRRSREMIEVERENTKRMTLYCTLSISYNVIYRDIQYEIRMTEEIRAEAMRVNQINLPLKYNDNCYIAI